MAAPMDSGRIMQLMLLCMMFMILLHGVSSDLAQDEKECSEPLADLSPCLPFITGQAKVPNQRCCTSLRNDINQNQTRKCLCVLVRDRNDPGLGFKVNATLALSLPSICHSPANVSACPALLHLPPNSADAQVFEQFVPQSTAATGVYTSSSSRGREKRSGSLQILGAISVWYLISVFDSVHKSNVT